MAVITHVAPHPEALVLLLCDQLAQPPEDPFTPEVVAVPTRGIERWLTQRIASGMAERGAGDGICANVRFPSPSRLVRDVLRATPSLAGAVSAWENPGLTGHVVAALDGNLDEPWMALVRRYLETDDGTPGPNRFAAATKITRLYTGYARRRPAMVRAWAAGADVGPGGDPVGDADIWQPRLWRLVRDAICHPSLPETLPDGLDPIRDGAVDIDLPGRLNVYGLTAADPFELDVLAALGAQRDVHLYVLHPSPALWDATATAAAATPATLATRAAGATHPMLAAHPMLASWAQESRELQQVLAASGFTATPIAAADPEPATLLAHLQHDIHDNRPPAFDPSLAERAGSGADTTLQIHVCHGARRQAEVMRDAVLHVLAADPTLEPRDVVIMTPDLATFAPLLEAAFPVAARDEDGAAELDGLPDLRLRIADRSPAAINPLVRFAATVLDLADSRLEAGVVRELVTRPVVQQRFGFDLDAAGAITRVIDDAHISWGFDAADRVVWGAGDVVDRTWSRGLDRALAGVFYADSPVRVVAAAAGAAGTVPLHGVEGQDATPVGLLAAIVDRIAAARRLLATPMATSQWSGAIAAAVRLLAAPAWADEWQLGQLERLLAETFPAPETGGPDPGGPDPVLTLPEARGAVAGWTTPRPSPLHFRTGDVTVCTLVPMRSVPYRVVGLLGMDDDRFPRTSRGDGDDLLADHEIVGDHDRSAEDRQLLLDALLAAGDHLIVTYAGRDQLTNAPLPPAVPIAELADTITTMVGAAGLTGLTSTHPLQSFSAENFTTGNNGAGPKGRLPFGFDPRQLAGARAVTERRPDATETAAPWPGWAVPDVVALDDLIRFLQHPVQRFMQARMGFTVPERKDLPDDTLPADLNSLDEWALKERLLSGFADGHPLDDLVARERASDGLPPGRLGDDDLDKAVAAASALWDEAVARGYDRQAMAPYRGTVELAGIAVGGAVRADPGAGHLFRVTASRIKGKQRLRVYAELAFLTALHPDVAWQAVVVGRRPEGEGHLAMKVLPFGPAATPAAERRAKAVDRLAELVALYVEGHRAPLPLPCESAFAWQRALAFKDRDKAVWALRDSWETGRFTESRDAAHRALLGDLARADDLLASGFEKYCARLWLPVLAQTTEKPL